MTIPGANTPDAADALRALFAPLPEGLDARFRSPLDPLVDYYSAYERAMLHAAALGHADVTSVWQCALNVGFMAGRSLASKAAHKAGEAAGLEKGKVEGLSEGKRLGFVAGRDFGEKQAMKLSKTPVPGRVLVDVGTDSPVTEPALSIPPPGTPINVSVPTDAPHATAIPPAAPRPPPNWADESFRIYAPDPTSRSASSPALVSTPSNPPTAVIPPTAPSAPFNWADEPAVPLVPDTPLPPPPPARDFSALRSDVTSLTPFSTLRHRAHRTQKSSRAPRRSAMPATSFRRHSDARASVPRPSTPFFAPKAFTRAAYVLDWDRDPRLSELSRVLRSMGWAR
ncbi:hypothetical protein DFH09DRAFT_1213555 [Mycena vulgaris]|nr:hypothetical protein DFH09DRAFT_1213555 [Mycena vulgaris]